MLRSHLIKLLTPTRGVCSYPPAADFKSNLVDVLNDILPEMILFSLSTVLLLLLYVISYMHYNNNRLINTMVFL